MFRKEEGTYLNVRQRLVRLNKNKIGAILIGHRYNTGKIVDNQMDIVAKVPNNQFQNSLQIHHRVV